MRHDAVDDQELERFLGEPRGERDEAVRHHLVRERLRDEDVIQHRLRVEVEPFRDLLDAIGAERALRVDPGDFRAAAAFVQRELRRDREGVADLRLASPARVGSRATSEEYD